MACIRDAKMACTALSGLEGHLVVAIGGRPSTLDLLGATVPHCQTLHPTPYTLHPTPYTLHSAPYTLHPTPYTLQPDSRAPNPPCETLTP